MKKLIPEEFKKFEALDAEQLPVSKDHLRGWSHFVGLYAAEHVAATEFVIGATFVALGAKTSDILIGLLIGNILATLSWTFITSPIAVDTRLSLYTYLGKVAGRSMSRLYNWANVLIFTVISAAMITVSSTAIRFLFNIPVQLSWYPTNGWFVLVVIFVGAFVVLITIYGFNAVSDFSSLCAPWLFVMFGCGAINLFPGLSLSVLDSTFPTSWAELIQIGDQSIWTGLNSNGEPGIGLLEVIGFAWAANTITHFGLIDMALLRFAKRKRYGLATSAGMLFGHYFAWIAAGIMGAGAAVLMGTSVVEIDPGNVAYYALGWSGFVIVIVAGWTTAITNLYRAGLAAQAIYKQKSRRTVTTLVGIITVITACFPFVFSQMLPLLTYAGLLVVPVGAIVFAEHQLFPKIGFVRYWASYKKLKTSIPAIVSWGLGLLFGFGLDMLQIISFYYLFIPTWIFTIFIYTLLAARFGAKDLRNDAEGVEKREFEEINRYHQWKRSGLTPRARDNSLVTKILKAVSWISLGLIVITALVVLLSSPDQMTYESHQQMFYRVAFAGTVVYFTTAYLALKRSKRTFDA